MLSRLSKYFFPAELSLLCLFIFAVSASAQTAAGYCIYRSSDGSSVRVDNVKDVPRRYRSTAQCFTGELARPGEISLEGSTRREDMASPLGPVQLRWPRKVEVLFGRTPKQAMIEAARTVKKAVQSPAFPPSVRNLELQWHVVFLDEDLPAKQIPQYLINNCHPGWMTPPAEIYIVAQRAAAGCSSQGVTAQIADKRLTQVLVHEMGHALENQLLPRHFARDRMRAEGFASWFESYAARFSPLLDENSIRREQRFMARRALEQSPGRFDFRGQAHDYARAAMYQSVIEERFGLVGLMRIYEAIETEDLGFIPAVEAEFGLSARLLEKAISDSLGRNP